jgi:hypothetical protein
LGAVAYPFVQVLSRSRAQPVVGIRPGEQLGAPQARRMPEVDEQRLRRLFRQGHRGSDGLVVEPLDLMH